MNLKLTIIRFTLIVFSISLLIGFIVNYNLSNEEQTLQLIQSPKVNDVYILEKEILGQSILSREKYLITQIISIDGENITFKVSSFVYLKVSDAIKGIRTDKLLIRNFFSNDVVTIDKTNIKKHWLEGRISDIGRSKDGMHLYGGVVIAKSNQPVKKKRKKRKGDQTNQQAIAYYQGNMGYEKDIDEAFRLFEQAAKDGHPYAQINLAQMYRDGEAVEIDENKALYWFAKAKQQGIAKSNEEYSRLCQKVVHCTE